MAEVMIFLTVVGMGMSVSQGRRAQRDAKVQAEKQRYAQAEALKVAKENEAALQIEQAKITEANVAKSQTVTEEKSRRLEKTLTREQSLARAKASASGVGGTTSLLYQLGLMETGLEELQWLSKVGEANIDVIQAEGGYASRSLEAQVKSYEAGIDPTSWMRLESQGDQAFWGGVQGALGYGSNLFSYGVNQNWWGPGASPAAPAAPVSNYQTNV